MIEMGSATTTWRLAWKRNFWLFALAVPGPFTACPRPDAESSFGSDATIADSVLRIQTALHRDLVENSVAVTSVSQPGIVFGFNDSGHRARLYAFDSLGRARGVWELIGAANHDSEAASTGPCVPGGPGNCLYVGDVGDNDARRPFVTLYRVPEPTIGTNGGPSSPLQVQDRLHMRYPDRPHDVEAMYVGPDGSVFLITKRRLLDNQRRPRRALVFRVPPSAWDSSGIVTAALVDSLPIVPGQVQCGQITDAALSPDGRLLAVRTYADVFVFVVDSLTRLPVPGQTVLPCSVRALDERQGEGLGWWWGGRSLLLTSEGSREPLHRIQCPLP